MQIFNHTCHKSSQSKPASWRRFVPPGPADRLRCSVVVTVLLKSPCVTSVPATFPCTGVKKTRSSRRLAELVTPLSVVIVLFFCKEGSSLILSAPSPLIISSVGDKGSPSPLPPTNPQHPLFWFCLCHLHKRVQRHCRDLFCVPKHPQLCLTLTHLKS